MKNLRNALCIITTLNPLSLVCLFAASQINSLTLQYSFVYLMLFSGIIGLVGLILTIFLQRAYRKAGIESSVVWLAVPNVLFVAGNCLWYGFLLTQHLAK